MSEAGSGWGKRGPAIAGREVEFEVQAYSDKRWLTEGTFDQEKEAIAAARALLAGDKVEEVKVLRHRSGTGLSLEKEVFSEKRGAREKKAVTLSGRITESRVCETVAQFMGLESRMVMNRVLREFLDLLVITPTELLHNYGYQRKLDSMGLVAGAVSQLAQAQASAGHGDVKVRLDAIYVHINEVMSKAQNAAAEKKRIPVLEDGKFAELCRRVEAGFPEEVRGYTIKVSLTNYLMGGNSLSGKLEQIAALLTEDVDKSQAAHLDDLISDLLGAGSLVQDVLGQQNSLGAALGVLADLVRGKLELDKVRNPTSQLQLVHSLLSGRGMPSSKAVLFERLQREYFSPKPLVRSNDPGIEREVLNAFIAKITDPNGKHLFGPVFEEQTKKRGDAIRRAQLQKLGIAT
jgi:hypothetical protein